MPAVAEANDNCDAHENHDGADGRAEKSRGALRFHCRCESPLADEIPNADAEMHGARSDANQEECEEPRILHGVVNVGVGGHAVREETFVVKMPGDKYECEQARPALNGEHPVADPRIRRDIIFAARPNVKSVERVIRKRHPDHQNFDGDAPGNGLQVSGLMVVIRFADQRITIRPNMVD